MDEVTIAIWILRACLIAIDHTRGPVRKRLRAITNLLDLLLDAEWCLAADLNLRLRSFVSVISRCLSIASLHLAKEVIFLWEAHNFAPLCDVATWASLRRKITSFLASSDSIVSVPDNVLSWCSAHTFCSLILRVDRCFLADVEHHHLLGHAFLALLVFEVQSHWDDLRLV